MALDGIAISALCHELNEKLSGGRIDKIHQPERDELIISVRTFGGAYKLLICANPSYPRIHITNSQKENPEKPPMFCMLMRKHLLNGRLLSIAQPDLERAVIFTFSSMNEMGDICELHLICELLSQSANVILTDENHKIIDCLRHSDIENSSRLLLPGATYSLPPKQDKLNPLTCDFKLIEEQLKTASLLQTIDGFSPLICREIEENNNLSSDRKSVV